MLRANPRTERNDMSMYDSEELHNYDTKGIANSAAPYTNVQQLVKDMRTLAYIVLNEYPDESTECTFAKGVLARLPGKKEQA
jgi:hypothetical protein